MELDVTVHENTCVDGIRCCDGVGWGRVGMWRVVSKAGGPKMARNSDEEGVSRSLNDDDC